MFKKPKYLKRIFAWILLTSLMVLGMMLIGAVTRLTDSGLSIVEWRLLMGSLPPLSDAEWQRIFALYQTTEQFQSLNSYMDLGDFKRIFWWEYIHRLWGRAIGVFYIVGLVFFLWRRAFPAGCAHHFAIILGLGAGQALLGWWMVLSGADNVSVAPYRLMLHLGLAFIIWGYLIWMLNIIYNEIRLTDRKAEAPQARRACGYLHALIYIVILSGALLAGLNGGFVYNEWPLMAGEFVPEDYWHKSYSGIIGFFKNSLNNPTAAQFHHRWLAALLVIAVIAFRISLWRHRLHSNITNSASLLVLIVLLQATIGILTLLYQVPLSLAILHQLGAALTFAIALWTLRELRGLS